jgi:nucleoside-diphosphate-sugar epimerase
MAALKVVFIGGTGIISSACAAHALTAGHDVTLVNRGTTATRPIPDGVTVRNADVRDPDAMRAALGHVDFDVAVDFVAYAPAHVQADIDVLSGRIGQYVFISSASAYHKPPRRLPIRESTPLHNPFWQYSRDKIACEELLLAAYRDTGFPAVVVRPSHTYDRTSLPILGGWTQIERMRRGEPALVHGDGTSLWTLTHHADFAAAFTALIGNTRTLGEAYTITSDDVLTWNQVYLLLAAAAGVASPQLVHVASETIAAAEPDWGPGLLGDKSHSMVFDNTKIKAVAPGWAARIPFEQGAREMVAWHDADPARRISDPHVDEVIDKLIADR